MNLAAGIIGLPNVGKSSLFNTITKLSSLVENYPFATIEPNIGIVNLEDERLLAISKLIQPEKTVFATFKFVDIAGLVKGASKGEGLGNKFLQNIRDVNALIHVVRCFNDSNVVNTSAQIDPLVDVQIVDLELIYADLELISNALKRIGSKKVSTNPQLDPHALLIRVADCLKKEQPVRNLTFNQAEKVFLKSYNLLTLKPVLYVGNVNDADITNPPKNLYFQQLQTYAANHQAVVVGLSVKLEYELSQLNPIDVQEIMRDYNIHQTGLQQLVHSVFKLLNLGTYFTAGKKEVRAWSFVLGSSAPICAGIIHSDFERGFIRVDVMKCADFLQFGSELKVKQHGKLFSEGKNYCVQDGDICHFKFNV